MRGIVLGLGNEIRGDDGAGIAAARMFAEQAPAEVDVRWGPLTALDVVEALAGHERALILDAVRDPARAAGEVLVKDGDDLAAGAPAPSHAVGLGAALAWARAAGWRLPRVVTVVGIVGRDLDGFREGLSPPVRKAIPAAVARARREIGRWAREPAGRGGDDGREDPDRGR